MWHNCIVSIIASSILMFSCWVVGYYDFSFLWIIMFIVLYAFKTHMWIIQEQKRTRLKNIILREQDAVIAQFGGNLNELPAWVQFPDTERIEWINKIIYQLWPYIGEYAKSFIIEFIEPQIRAQMPKPFKSFKFIQIDCGDMPCRVGGLKVYTENVGRDKIIIDMDIVYAGDAQFSVKVCGFQGGIKQIVLSGKIRCVLQPLLAYPPMIGGISGSFIEMPKYDFDFTGMGEFVQLPGLINAIRSVIDLQISNLCILPNSIVISLAPNVDVTKLFFPEPDGVIRLKIIEAKNLVNKDASIILKNDKSDPYCEIQVGSQLFKTQTIKNNLNPIFNECFEAVVDQASGQKLRIELFDEDVTSSDELGRLSIPLDVVRNSGEINRWYHLEGCKHGEIHLKISWLNLSTNFKNACRDAWESEWLTADKPMHPALLTIFIDSVCDLPYPKTDLEPSPFIKLTLGQITQKTPVKVRTINPLYQTKFMFFVKNPEGQELKITAIDDGTRRELGDLTIPIIGLIKQKNMEIFQETFLLQHGIHSSRIVLTIRLRTFLPTTNVYGTGFYIERAERSVNCSSEFDKNSKIILTKANKKDELVPETNIENFSSTLKRKVSSTFTAGTTTTNGSARNPNGSIVSSQESLKIQNNSLNSAKIFKRMGKLSKIYKHTLNELIRGYLQFGMHYDDKNFKLIINIISAKELIPLEKNKQASPYVSAKLISLDSTFQSKGKRRTESVENSLNPCFNTIVDFNIHFSELQKYKLQLIVKDAINYGVLSKPPIIGKAELRLSNFDPKIPLINQWISLELPYSSR